MDWLWDFFDRIRMDIIFSFLMNLHPFDWTVLFVLLWGMAYGSRKGFSEMFGKVVEVVLVTFIVVTFYPQLAETISVHIPGIPLSASEPMAFLFLAVFSWVSIAWILNALGKVFHVEVSGILKPLGGMVFGLVHCVILVSFAIHFFLIFSIASFDKMINSGKTLSGPIIVKVLPTLYQITTSPLQKQQPVKVFKAG